MPDGDGRDRTGNRSIGTRWIGTGSTGPYRGSPSRAVAWPIVMRRIDWRGVFRRPADRANGGREHAGGAGLGCAGLPRGPRPRRSDDGQTPGEACARAGGGHAHRACPPSVEHPGRRHGNGRMKEPGRTGHRLHSRQRARDASHSGHPMALPCSNPKPVHRPGNARHDAGHLDVARPTLRADAIVWIIVLIRP